MPKKIIFFLLLIFSAFFISAADFIPQGNVNLKGIYAIINATSINATIFCDMSGNCKTVPQMGGGGTGGGSIQGIQSLNNSFINVVNGTLTNVTVNLSGFNGLFMSINTKVGNTTSEIFGVCNNGTLALNSTLSSLPYIALGTKLGNTTTEIFGVCNNGTLALNSSLINYVLTTTKLGNTTAEIWSVVNNNTFALMSNLSNYVLIGTKLGNTTSEIWGVVNNGSFILIGTKLGNTSSEIASMIDNGSVVRSYNTTWITGNQLFNTSVQIWTVINNGSFVTYDNLSNSSIVRSYNTSWITANQNYNSSSNMFNAVNNGTFVTYGNLSNSTIIRSGNITWITSNQLFNTSTQIWNIANNGTLALNSSLSVFLQNNTNAVFSNLGITNAPATCPSGSFITYFNGTNSICSNNTNNLSITESPVPNSYMTGITNGVGLFREINYNIFPSLNVMGNINASTFTGNGVGITNVNAATLNGYSSSSFISSGTKLGNTTAEIFSVANNGTLATVSSLGTYLQNNTNVNISNLWVTGNTVLDGNTFIFNATSNNIQFAGNITDSSGIGYIRYNSSCVCLKGSSGGLLCAC